MAQEFDMLAFSQQLNGTRSIQRAANHSMERSKT